MKNMSSKTLLRSVFAALLCVFVANTPYAESLTLPFGERPEWLARDGIVMAGSWEPLLFRVRRDGSDGYVPTDEQRAAYEREHSPEMVEQLKALGVNFVMMHCYKGAGLEAERESMADAVRFAKLCHDAGLRVGVYNYSGAFIWELFFKEVPQAEDWVLLDENGKKRQYGRATYRYYWNRNHPDAQAFYRNLARFAVNDIKADLLHFDNYSYGPGLDANSVQRFREHLRNSFTPQQLRQMGIEDVDGVQPPMTGPPDNLLRRAWLNFHAQSLTDSYHDMGRYARTLRKDILLECNPGGAGSRIGTRIDHGRLLQGGEAYWDEGRRPGLIDGKLKTRIQTYKIARRMDNMAFAYTTTPLEMAEAMAFNLDCLGCVCWFEYGRIVNRPGSRQPVAPEVAPFIRFFHERRDLLRNAEVVADATVLRSYASQVFADSKHPEMTARVEQALIENRMPFQIIYDHHLEDLEKHKVLVLAGCIALSDQQIEQIKGYVQAGGRVCVIGQVATHDKWMMPRESSPLDELPGPSVVYADEEDDPLDAIKRACGGALSLSVDAPIGLCCELTEQPGRRLVHFINYRSDGPIKDVAVRLRLPAGRHAGTVTLASPERGKDVALTFEADDDGVTFTVPEVGVYEIALIAIE